MAHSSASRKKRKARNVSQRRKKSRDSGKCTDCHGQRSLPHATKCRVCYLKRKATRHLGTASRWGELEALLLRQLSRCAYTGKPIDLGSNASIEHVEPASRSPGRASDIANIRWVAQEVNLAKRAMPLREFIEMCKAVLKNFGFEVKRR
jgi:hypothetical protein